MDFTFSEEQQLLRDSLASYLADHYDYETRRRVVASELGWRPEVWRAVADDLGILGAALPADVGGLGGGPVEILVIMEELGRALVVEPFLGTVVVAGGLLQRDGTPVAAERIGQIIRGEARAAFAYAESHARYDWRNLTTTARKIGSGYVLNGAKAVVIGAPAATHLVVTARTGGAPHEAGGISAFWVDKTAAGIATRDYAMIDGQRAAEITFENVALSADALIGEAGEAAPALEAVIDEATAALCAEALGVLRRLHDGAVEYTKARQQFGKPLASFQVLRHRMVDMYIELEQAVSMTYRATIRLADPDPGERARAVSAAKVQVGAACRFVAQWAVQLHGGMGLTDELAIGSYFKRATVIETQFGDADHHLARFAARSFGPARLGREGTVT